ncbi:hypothetical protein [Pontibacter arcticus]|uniref:DoxX protein n=1 Tax=Pontibacter arcticus TaxID=2080288 RepID=A0A364RFT4_9BACT|nr:hypothetical protein [Pontibacter arcticus]RAU83142.1 hypothetical protein DP923_07905 [Pontibacter arcticus]
MNKKQFFLNGISIFLGLIFFTAGMAKVYAGHKFPGLIGPVWLEDKLAEYGLALFARYIAYSQIIAGFILLTLRYRTLGAIILVPMVLSILLVTVSQNWVGTPYVVSGLLVLNLILLLADAGKFLPLAGFPSTYLPAPQTNPFKMLLIWLAGFGLVLVSIQLSFMQLMLSYVICVSGLLIGLVPYFIQGRAGRSIKRVAAKLSGVDFIPAT